jgi:two-component system cell cycle sensor histidine kinase/response regulator CckA
VLLVEDDELVRNVAIAVLSQQGYNLLVASNGHDALLLAQEHEDQQIELLLTDIVMPLMGGRELANRFKNIYPGTKILYVSGYTDGFSIDQDVVKNEAAFLRKPFTLEELTQKFREVLDA